MKTKHIYILAVFVAVICIFGAFSIHLIHQSEKVGIYYNAVKEPANDNAVYKQEVKSNIVEIGFEVLKTETDHSPEQYKLIVNLANSTERLYAYKVTLKGYSDSLICNTSNTKITYAENYSNGERNNAKTVYYFMPDGNTSVELDVGTLDFALQRNDLSTTVGCAEVEVSAYSTRTDQLREIITQQICFNLI